MRGLSIDGALCWPDFKPTWPSQWNRTIWWRWFSVSPFNMKWGVPQTDCTPFERFSAVTQNPGEYQEYCGNSLIRGNIVTGRAVKVSSLLGGLTTFGFESIFCLLFESRASARLCCDWAVYGGAGTSAGNISHHHRAQE